MFSFSATFVCWLLGLYLAACATKLAFALNSRDPFVFAVWDGGTLLAGKTLPSRVVPWLLANAALVSALCFATLLGFVPFAVTKIVSVSLMVVGGTAMFVFARPLPQAPEDKLFEQL